jgi:hypothetical protein
MISYQFRVWCDVMWCGVCRRCVVTGLLLDKMVAANLLDPVDQLLCVLAIGGVHQGPFPDTISDGYSSTRELFQLGQIQHSLSQRYVDAVCRLLTAGVKYFVTGSWFDQVVPLYSACMYAIEEPPPTASISVATGQPMSNLCRAIFVQSDLFQSLDFLTSLARLCLHVRNLGGTSDVLIHLSGFIRGRLLQRREGAHSVVHSNVDVFGTATHWFLAFRGQPSPAPFQVSLRTTAQFGVFFTEAFTNSDLNRHLLVRHTSQLLATCRMLRLDHELDDLRTNFLTWKPDNRSLQQLQSAMAPLFKPAKL